MKHFNIKPEESILYEKTFSQCDVDKSGKVSIFDAKKLLLRSGLSISDLEKVSELCGANRLGYFGRSQFFIALKIIALIQAGNPLDKDIIQIKEADHMPTFNVEINESQLQALQKSIKPQPLMSQFCNIHHRSQSLTGGYNLERLHEICVANRYSNSLNNARNSKGCSGLGKEFSCSLNDWSNCRVEDSKSSSSSSEDENPWNDASDQDNKGLLNSTIKTEFNEFYEVDNNDCSSSSHDDHDSSSSFESDDINGTHPDLVCDPCLGYRLMEAVEDAVVNSSESHDTSGPIPTATNEQLEHYTKCFQSLQPFDNEKVTGFECINFFSMYSLDRERFNQILYITDIKPESPVALAEFSKALHLIIHCKKGYSIPEKLPENLLPLEFEQPDEPFSFDLSAGEMPDGSYSYQLSTIESSFSADGDISNLDYTDIAVNRNWGRKKHQIVENFAQKKHALSQSFNSPNQNNTDPSVTKVNQDNEMVAVSRPRPLSKKSLTLPQTIPRSVAPPPPPRSSVPSENVLKRLSLERNTGDSSVDEAETPERKLSESSKSEMTNRTGTLSDTRKQLQVSIRELKSRNHVLLRLNNEMTSELEELRDQRVNLHLQLEYIRQSQLDAQ